MNYISVNKLTTNSIVIRLHLKKYLLFLIGIMLTATIMSGQKRVFNYSDGPYVFFKNDTTEIIWMDKGKLSQSDYIGSKCQGDQSKTINKKPIDFYYNLAERDIALDHQIAYDDVSEVAAISDIHGQYDIMHQLLTANGVINENGEWNFGTGHLVITGDIFDRGDKVLEIVWFLIDLEKQAEAAGGKVHTLIGNHEWMVLSSDVRYIHKKYRYVSALFKKQYHLLFQDDSFIGRWLRSKPIYVKVNGMAFVHGGISEELFNFTDLSDINSIYYDEILSQDTLKNTPLADFLTNTESPLWFRGYAYEGEYDERRTKKLLKKMGADRIIVGHTSMPNIFSINDNRIIFIDSSIKLGKGGEMLFVKGNKYYSANESGDQKRL